MALVIPYVKQTHTVSGTWTAAKANVVEDGVNDAHYMPSVKALKTAAQSLTTSTWTLVTWNTETGGWDTAGNAASTMHDNSTNPARLIARHAGKFLVVAFVQWAPNGTGIRIHRIQKNSEALPSAAESGFVANAVTGADMDCSATAVIDMAVNDYVVVTAFQSSGGGLNIQIASSFSMTRLA